MSKRYVGLDIGGTKCAAALAECDSSPVLLEREVFPTQKSDPDEILFKYLSIIREWKRKYELDGIGISCGGPLDSGAGIIQSPPNLPGWDNIEIVSYFERYAGISCKLQNDANACALAEWKYGAGRGLNNLVFLTFGTGLGAGLILDGRLYEGTNGNAGEVGHVRLARRGPVGYGKPGSAEGFCSGAGIAQLARAAAERELKRGRTPNLIGAAGGLDGINAQLVARLADEGDALCLEVYRRCGKAFGEIASILIDLFNPQAIIAGGVLVRAGHLILPYAERVIKKEALRASAGDCRILPAGLGESLGDFAAVSVIAGEEK